MKTIWGLFNTYRQADAAVATLQARGFGAGAIHALAPESSTRLASGGPMPLDQAGGLTGLLAGNRGHDIKGMGPVLATGTLGRALARAASARSDEPDHGLEEALMVAGLSPGYARLYLQGLLQGNTLLVVEAADPQERDVVNVLRKYEVQMLAGLPIAMPGEADFEQAVRRENEAGAVRMRGVPEKGAAEARPGEARQEPKRPPRPGSQARPGNANRAAQQKQPRPQGQTGDHSKGGTTHPGQPRHGNSSGPAPQSAPRPDRRSGGSRDQDTKK